jgi:signal peptidase II
MIKKYFPKPFFSVYRPEYIIAILVGATVDLVSKYWIIMELGPYESREILGDFFRLSLTFNTGFVFGFFQNNSIVSLVATLFAIIFLFFYRWQNGDLGNPWGWNLVMAGAIGNCLDKFFIKIPGGGGIRFGFFPTTPGEFIGVVDFFDFDWPDFLLFQRWPAFNVADSCVLIGVAILIITMKVEEE